MSAPADDITAGSGITELASVASVWRKRGHEVRVSVADAGHGPAISLREWVTPEAHGPERIPTVREAKAGKMRQRRSDYVGPTRAGFWLSVDTAEELYQAMGEAIALAATMGDES